MILKCNRTFDGFEINACEGEKTAASLTIQIDRPYVMVHNTVNLWTPRAWRFYKEGFDLLKKDMKDAGYKFIITTGKYDNDLPKKQKYWRMMGLDIFTDMNYQGEKIRAAGLEL
jgi:hypothetical protein